MNVFFDISLNVIILPIVLKLLKSLSIIKFAPMKFIVILFYIVIIIFVAHAHKKAGDQRKNVMVEINI